MEERPIQFNVLTKDELTHEVKIRGTVPADRVTDLREQIRELAKKLPTDQIVSFEGDIALELQTIGLKLDELHLLVSPEDRKLTLKNLNRVQALAHHLFHRLTRIDPEKEEDILCHSDHTVKLDKILTKLDNFYSVFKSTIYTDPLRTPEATPTAIVSSKYQSVASLNHTYDGKSCIKDYLLRLEELCTSRGISEDKLFVSASELFVGDTLCWYRGVVSSISSWSELKALLLQDYLPDDYNRRLKAEILGRTQGLGENIVTYLSIMQNYFGRLSTPLPEEEKFDIVLNNIRPEYMSSLSTLNVNTFTELKMYCRKIEASNKHAQHFVEPPKSSANLVAADLAYKQISKTPVNMVKPSIPQFCHRCRVDTHSYRQCTSRKIVCFGCGKEGVIRPKCPDCSPRKGKEGDAGPSKN